MVRLNKNKLTQAQLEKLFSQFSNVVAPHDQQHADCVLTELLGKEERIMVAKRLAAAILLVEGLSMYKISQVLKLSQSTVGHIASKISSGQFDHTLSQISKTKEDYFSLLTLLDSILHLGGALPHYNGLDRYKFLT